MARLEQIGENVKGYCQEHGIGVTDRLQGWWEERGWEDKKKKKNEIEWCKYRACGFRIGDNEKKKAHLDEVGNYCKNNGKSKDFIASERKKCLSSIITSETGGIGNDAEYV